jgi:hypothetical protein
VKKRKDGGSGRRDIVIANRKVASRSDRRKAGATECVASGQEKPDQDLVSRARVIARKFILLQRQELARCLDQSLGGRSIPLLLRDDFDEVRAYVRVTLAVISGCGEIVHLLMCVAYLFDTIIRRTVAKIAFNYLAYSLLEDTSQLQCAK